MVGNWSAVRSFTVDRVAPLAPALSAPADNATTNGTPIFTWLASAGANAYRFEIDSNSDFDTAILSPVLTVKSYQPATLFAGTYFWRVQARDAAGNWSEWPSTYRTVIIKVMIPAAPSLISPANSLFTNDDTPAFAWNSVPYGSTYQIQVDTLSTFTTNPLPIDHTGLAGETSYTPSASLAVGKYYWKVRANNGQPNGNGVWSTVRSFTIDKSAPLPPNLSGPADNAGVIGTPTFSWLASIGANAYQLAYADNTGFSGAITSPILTTLSYRPAYMPAHIYYWRVQARDAAGNWSGWPTTYRTITINATKPVAPALLIPTNAALLRVSKPSFTWGSVAYGNTYEIQIDTLPTFPAPWVVDSVGDPGVTSFTPTNSLNDGKYYWRVRGITGNPAVPAGNWSGVRSFTIDTSAPNPPVLSTPANGITVLGTPTFTWLASLTATAYQFEYADRTDFSTAMISPVLTTKSYKPTTMPAGTYYWRVQARDAAGNWSGWPTTYWAIIIKPLIPTAPVLTSPANLLVTNVKTPSFMWSSVPYGYTYEIQIDTVPTFLNTTPHLAGAAGVTYYVSPSLTAGKYFWKVRAKNSFGQPGTWSAVRSFTITP